MCLIHIGHRNVLTSANLRFRGKLKYPYNHRCVHVRFLHPVDQKENTVILKSKIEILNCNYFTHD